MAVGNQTPPSVASDYATQAFIVEQKISQVSTTTLARVIDCTNDGGIVPTGTLTVQILVNMLSGNQTAIEHAPLYKVPYKRIQGGSNAVILDPQRGDIGIIGFCERDISAVKKTRKVSNPGSNRKYSKADGVWLATVWAAQAPAQYIVFANDGISVVSPTAVTLQAPVVRIIGALEQTEGNASFAQNVAIAGTATAQEFTNAANIGLGTHKHPTAPTGPQSSPVP